MLGQQVLEADEEACPPTQIRFHRYPSGNSKSR